MSFEFLAFSDLHAHSFTYGSKLVPAPNLIYNSAFTPTQNNILINSRLCATLDTVIAIRQYCIEHDIQNVLFGGDLFHTHGTIKADVLYCISRVLKSFAAYGIDVHMIPGNHDYMDRSGFFHTLGSLAYTSTGGGRIIVHSRNSNVTLFGSKSSVRLFVVPYQHDTATLIQELNAAVKRCRALRKLNGGLKTILLAHTGIQGARVGSDYVLINKNDLKVPDVDWSVFDLCLFGHYHEHQQVFANGYFIGSPLQHNWSDAGSTKGWLHVKLDDQSVNIKQVPNTVAPVFHVIDSSTPEEQLSKIRECDFVTYVKSSEDEVVTESLPKSATLDVKLVASSQEDVDMVLDSTKLSPTDLIDPWVDATGDGRSDLKELGKQILAEAIKDTL